MGDLAVELAVAAIVRNGGDGRGHSQNGYLDGRHFELRLLMRCWVFDEVDAMQMLLLERSR
jgi:hypothetical protein